MAKYVEKYDNGQIKVKGEGNKIFKRLGFRKEYQIINILNNNKIKKWGDKSTELSGGLEQRYLGINK